VLATIRKAIGCHKELIYKVISRADGGNVGGLTISNIISRGMISKGLIVLAIALLISASSLAFATEPNESADRAAIEAFTRKFLRAFENLDMQQFIACFADNATVFFPMPEPPGRVDGKLAIQQRFAQVLLRSASQRSRVRRFIALRPRIL
jgi:hypothetical protein